MKLAYFDCFSGVSGDMLLGALVDAGCELNSLESELRQLPIPGWTMSAAKVGRGALNATLIKVETPAEPQKHRSLSTILSLIEQAKLAPRVAERAKRIFQRLGEAEARIHNVPVERVHFHEVGAVDAIIDIVGASIGFELLGLEEFVCSPLNVGGGHVETQHGILPVPAPATAELLRGAPIYSSGIERELVTPTGAAIISTLAARFGPQPSMTLRTVGYGAGQMTLREQPNVLRLLVGDAAVQVAPASSEEITVLEANIDDMTPQIYGYFAERALAEGALEVFSTPAQMKKNRPGQLITVLCEPGAEDRLASLIFRETTTIGLRSYAARRRTLERESVQVETSWGPVRVKVSRFNGYPLNTAPEYEDCHRIATERGLPLRQVLAEANFQFRKQHVKEG